MWKERLRAGLLAGGLVGAGVVGCNKSPAPEVGVNGVAPTAVEPVDGTVSKKPVLVNYHESFDDAVITEVLEGHHLPPDMTVAGLKTGPLRAAIEKLWPSIKLTDPAGKPISRVVRIETTEGPVEITVRPELAPNHVRNFLALAKLGYYNGLFFERNVHQEADIDGEKSRLDLLLAGCPLGSGEDGFGHLGYFVRGEFNPDIKHELGTVGFWHEEAPDSAGTRFYIAMGPAPALDGKFTVVGQVTSGLEALRRISAHPVRSTDPTSPESDRPVRASGIRSVTIVPDIGEK